MPAPGGRQQLLEQAGRVYSRRLDRSRPLWEIYLIQGLEGGKVALLSKTHHAAVDGLSSAEIMSALYDLTVESRVVDPPTESDEAGGIPGGINLLAHGLKSLPRYPINLASRLGRLLPHADLLPSVVGLPGTKQISRSLSKVRSTINREEDAHVIERRRIKAPRGPYGGLVSPHRIFGIGSVPLDDVKSVKNAFGVKVNDVVISLVAASDPSRRSRGTTYVQPRDHDHRQGEPRGPAGRGDARYLDLHPAGAPHPRGPDGDRALGAVHPPALEHDRLERARATGRPLLLRGEA